MQQTKAMEKHLRKRKQLSQKEKKEKTKELQEYLFEDMMERLNDPRLPHDKDARQAFFESCKSNSMIIFPFKCM